MQQLADWMDAHGETDHTLAPKLGVSRVQVSRIRRGITGASKPTALKLEQITGIPWPSFIDPKVAEAA